MSVSRNLIASDGSQLKAYKFKLNSINQRIVVIKQTVTTTTRTTKQTLDLLSSGYIFYFVVLMDTRYDTDGTVNGERYPSILMVMGIFCTLPTCPPNRANQKQKCLKDYK